MASREGTKRWLDSKLTVTNAILTALWVMLATDIIDKSGPILGSYIVDLLMVVFLGCLLYKFREMELRLNGKQKETRESETESRVVEDPIRTLSGDTRGYSPIVP